MPPSKSNSSAVKGRKIVFDEAPVTEDTSDLHAPLEPMVIAEADEDDEDDQDDDEEPELVNTSIKRAQELEILQAETREVQRKRLAQQARSARIQSHKAGPSTTRQRLAQSSHLNSEARSGEDSGSDEESEVERNEGSSSRGSYEGDEGLGVDSHSDVDSEDLGELPTDPESRRLQARMQAAMEAAGRDFVLSDEDELEAAVKAPTNASAVPKGDVDETSAFDLAPHHLPMSILKKAEEFRIKAMKRKAQDDLEVQGTKRLRRRKRAAERTARIVDSKTGVRLLDAPSVASLPPPVRPRTSLVTPKSSAEKFKKKAMQLSGIHLSVKDAGRKRAQVAMARGSGAPVGRFATQ